MAVNVVVLTGRLGRDPEVRSTTSGKSVASFSIAVDDGFGERKTTDWWDIECWDKVAEAVGRLAFSGKRVTVVGKLKKDSWKDQKTGDTRTRTKISASSVEIVDFADKNQGDGHGEVADEDIPF